MVKKVFIIIIIFVFMASVCAVPVSATALPPNLGGFIDDMQDATFKYADGVKLTLDNVLDLLLGKKTVSEFIDDGRVIADEYGLSFVLDVINSVDKNTITARELVDLVVNAVKSNMSSNGGSMSNFPLNDGGYWQVGNFTLKPYNFFSGDACTVAGFICDGPWQSFSQPFSGVGVYYPNGTLYHSYVHGRAFGSPGTSQSLSINNITLSYDTNFVIATVYYTISYSDNGVSHTSSVTATVFFNNSDWGDIVDDPFNVTDTPDVDDLSDDDLKKYIDNLLNNLNTMYPDLSTVEGLLQAILNQLKNSGGCDCSDVLAQINAAIISLANDSNVQNAQIIALLQAIKDNVNNDNGNNGSATDLDPLLQKIDKIIADLDYLKMINTIELLTDGWDKLTAAEKSYLDEYAKLIVTMGNKFGFSSVNNVISSFNSIIFTNSPPRDLTFTYQGKNYVFLSTSLFGKFSSSVATVRSFISILIIVSWAYSIRRKILEGI